MPSQPMKVFNLLKKAETQAENKENLTTFEIETETT